MVQNNAGSNQDILITTWICSAIACFIILIRLAGRKYRKQSLVYDDYIAALSLLILWSRTGMINTVLINGTNNVSISKLASMTEEQIERRELGSKLTLGTRILYAGFVWCMKWCMVIFYERLTQRQHGYLWATRITKYLLVITFMGVICSTLLECTPFNHYWQVKPNPGKRCTAAEAQLLTMGICNIFTDMVLIFLPVPLIMRARLPTKRKIQLIALFGIGIFLIVITVIRLPIIINNAEIQRARTLWASVEIMASSLVVNFPILFTYIKDPKGKKATLPSHHLSRSTTGNSGSTGSRIIRRQEERRWSVDEADLLQEPEPVNLVIETKQEIIQQVINNHDIEKAALGGRRLNDITTMIWTENEISIHSDPSSRAESRQGVHPLEQ